MELAEEHSKTLAALTASWEQKVVELEAGHTAALQVNATKMLSVCTFVRVVRYVLGHTRVSNLRVRLSKRTRPPDCG